MALSLKDLESVIAPLTELGKGEDTFEVGGLTITVRTLTPEEEIAVQRYARGALTEGDANDQLNALDYLDRFRAGCLGYSIMRIGPVDFHGVSTVETGETLASGVAVKVKKHEAIIEVIKTWSRPMVVAVYARFTDLVERIEENIEKSVSFDDDHIDAQIARLEERLSELKATKAKVAAGESDPRKETIEHAANREPPPPRNEAPPPPPEPVTWETARVNRVSEEAPLSVDVGDGVPKALVTEETPPPPAETPSPSVRRPVFGDRPPPREPPADPGGGDPLRDVASSLVDISDPAVIEAENLRLMAERAKRVPPHQSAREVARAVEAQTIEQSGTKDGVPVFKMPTETLTREAPTPPQGRTPPPVTRSNANPHFRPAK